ncbi:MAG: (R)-hydratase [Rhodospirillaceae bacterium]|nr:(R)-hydratase [Rhodospirillaceae bacterium]|tara:strand:+ start:1745 stop:2206 length:462 start_codon:yes stop_codon:yes gene_type:complete
MLANPESDDIHGYYFEDLSVGMSASYAKTITETDIVLFAGISGDVNPVHLNQEFASDTMFEGRIAHGMLTANFISTVLGTKLPGPGCIYLRQDLRFLAPVRPGDTVHAQITITEIDAERKRVYAHTVCRVGDVSVVESDATLFVPKRDKSKAA